MKNREDELLHSNSELEAKNVELQKPRLKESMSEFQDNKPDLNSEVKLEDIIPTNDVSIQRSNIVTNDPQNENNEILYHTYKVEHEQWV